MTTFRKKLLFLPFSLCLILFNSCTSDTDPKKDQRPESKTCTRDEFCGEREICFKGNCVETKSKACSDDSHCRVNEICDKNLKVCRSEKLGLGCEELKDCPFGAICLDRICRATKELNYCNYKDKCDQNSYCDSKLNICRPYIQCGDSTGCPDGFYCEIESKFCKLVKKDLDCDPKSEKSTCSHSQFCHEGKCVECFKDQHCPTELICKKSVMKCLGKDSCGSDSECKKNYYCEPRLYQCVPKNRPCLLELDCPVGYSCDQSSKTCKATVINCKDDAHEPNNDKQTSTKLSLGNMTQLSLCQKDYDFFKVEADAKDYHQIGIKTKNNVFGLVAEQLDSHGKVLQSQTLTPTEGVNIKVYNETKDIFYLKISSPSRSLGYSIESSLFKNIQNKKDRFEPNNDSNSATLLKLGNHQNLNIGPKDKDYFTTRSSSSGKTLKIFLLYGQSPGELGLVVYKSGSNQIYRVAVGQKNQKIVTIDPASYGDTSKAIVFLIYGDLHDYDLFISEN